MHNNTTDEREISFAHGKVTKFDEEIDVDKYTLEGKWTPEQITVTFYDGDTKVGESTGAYDTTISSVPEPSIKEHYTGCKWVDNDGHEVTKYPAENTELHAKWIPEVYTVTITSEENPHVTYSEQVEYKGYISKEAVRGILEFDETKYDRPKESFQWTIGGEAKSVSQLEVLQIEEDTDIVGSWVPATIHHGRIDFQDFQIHEGLPEYPG